LNLIITPQVFQNRLRRREAASEEEQFAGSATAFFIRSPWGLGENRT
jgi:hypothetical protein